MHKRSFNYSLAVSLVCLLGSLSPLSADDYQQFAAESVESYLAAHPYAAVTVGIIDAEGSQVCGFGQLDPENAKSHPTGKTIYQIGSITKVFTTTMLAEQVTQGHMQLDDPAQKYLPADLVLPKEKNREITLEELATHHSGLPRLPQLIALYFIGAGHAEDPYSLLGWEQIARMLRSLWLTSPIGTEYEYSNLGMGLLGKALVHATKSHDYEQLLKMHITEPLDLNDTCIALDEDQTSRLARALLSGGQETVPWHFASLEGCGAIFSTVDDLLIFAAANLGLKETMLADAIKMAQQSRPKYTWSLGTMGLGWHLQNDSKINERVIWHNGMTGGYSSMLMMVPDKKLAVVVLSNVAASADQIAVDIVRSILTEDQTQEGN